MKTKTKEKWIWLIPALCLLLILGGVFYVQKELNSITVYVSSHRLPQRSIIEEKDIMVLTVPAKQLPEGVVRDKELILGKTVKRTYGIPKNSYFYEEVLENINDIDDRKMLLLEKGESSYELYLNDVKSNPVSLREGITVDVYLTVEKDNRVYCDCLFRKVPIIAAYNQDYQSLEMNSGKMAYVLSLALNQKDIPLFDKALVIGRISLQLSKDYAFEGRSVLLKESEVYPFLLNEER